MMDWDYLRYLRALAIGGTLAKAGELLGVHQTTVLRRLDQMEDALGVRFFERNPNGLRLTPAGAGAGQPDRCAPLHPRGHQAHPRPKLRMDTRGWHGR